MQERVNGKWCGALLRVFVLVVSVLVLVGYMSGLRVGAVAYLLDEDKVALDGVLRNARYLGDSLSNIPYYNGGTEEYFSLFEYERIRPEGEDAYWQAIFQYSEFNSLDIDVQNGILSVFEEFLTAEDSGVSKEAQQIINSEIRRLLDDDIGVIRSHLLDEVKPDVLRGAEILDPITSTLGLVSGVAVILLSMGLLLMTLVDLLYITTPQFRDYVESHAVEDRKRGGKRPLFVSYEAITAVRDALDSKVYINPLFIYFKRRVLVILVLAICLVYLLGGLIGNVIVELWGTLNDAFGGWGMQ